MRAFWTLGIAQSTSKLQWSMAEAPACTGRSRRERPVCAVRLFANPLGGWNNSSVFSKSSHFLIGPEAT
jgi:hypothetical protein